jgi:hypothetical protein
MTKATGRRIVEILGAPFLLTALFGAYLLFLKGPANTIPQFAFRVALFSIGTAGTMVIAILRILLRPKPPVE